MKSRSVILALSLALCFLTACGRGMSPYDVLKDPESANDTLRRNAAIYFHFFGTPSEQAALQEYLPDTSKAPQDFNTWLKQSLIILLIVQFATILVMTSQFRKQKKQEEELKALYDQLRAEYEQVRSLPLMVADFPPASRETLEKKMRALGAFFSDSTPPSLDLVADQLDTLTQNRKELLETIGMLYAAYHPRFISHLLERNLTTLEVGYCCLLVMGLRTGELKDVINRSGVYNINVTIRRKLDIDANASTLSSYLKQLYASLG